MWTDVNLKLNAPMVITKAIKDGGSPVKNRRGIITIALKEAEKPRAKGEKSGKGRGRMEKNNEWERVANEPADGRGESKKKDNRLTQKRMTLDHRKGMLHMAGIRARWGRIGHPVSRRPEEVEWKDGAWGGSRSTFFPYTKVPIIERSQKAQK